MKVLLLAGGWSPEREVSLKGGEQIAAALKEKNVLFTALYGVEARIRGPAPPVPSSPCTRRRPGRSSAMRA